VRRTSRVSDARASCAPALTVIDAPRFHRGLRIGERRELVDVPELDTSEGTPRDVTDRCAEVVGFIRDTNESDRILGTVDPVNRLIVWTDTFHPIQSPADVP
jgi:hypothetical protein